MIVDVQALDTSSDSIGTFCDCECEGCGCECCDSGPDDFELWGDGPVTEHHPLLDFSLRTIWLGFMIVIVLVWGGFMFMHGFLMGMSHGGEIHDAALFWWHQLVQ